MLTGIRHAKVAIMIRLNSTSVDHTYNHGDSHRQTMTSAATGSFYVFGLVDSL